MKDVDGCVSKLLDGVKNGEIVLDELADENALEDQWKGLMDSAAGEAQMHENDEIEDDLEEENRESFKIEAEVH